MPSRVCKLTNKQNHRTKVSEYLMCTTYVPFFSCRLNVGKDISADWL